MKKFTLNDELANKEKRKKIRGRLERCESIDSLDENMIVSLNILLSVYAPSIIC